MTPSERSLPITETRGSRDCAAKPDPIEPLLTAADIAVITQVSVRTVRRWHELGEIPAGLRIGAQVRWRRDEIEAFLLGPPKPFGRGERK